MWDAIALGLSKHTYWETTDAARCTKNYQAKQCHYVYKFYFLVLLIFWHNKIAHVVISSTVVTNLLVLVYITLVLIAPGYFNLSSWNVIFSISCIPFCTLTLCWGITVFIWYRPRRPEEAGLLPWKSFWGSYTYIYTVCMVTALWYMESADTDI